MTKGKKPLKRLSADDLKKVAGGTAPVTVLCKDGMSMGVCQSTHCSTGNNIYYCKYKIVNGQPACNCLG
jgi:hypothetical protein